MAANFTTQDFTNANVQNARNPHPVYGYAHGPITNPNADWVPNSHAVTEPGRPLPALSAAENASSKPPVPLQVLPCWIEIGVAGSGQMCGHTFASQPALRRHIRTAHPGAVTNPRRANASDQMILAGQNALKQFVVSKGWQKASFLHEPSLTSGLINEYATACEHPFGTASAEDCRDVLEIVNLWTIVMERGGLDAAMNSAARSQGPTSTILAAHAVLRQRIRGSSNGILLLDEVSSSVDKETERSMQSIIKAEFQRHTIVAVSHRLNMIVDFNTGVVMDKGEVAEVGNPQQLARTVDTKFRD
ncbi:uncharacterized protein BCR38DRAFT_524830 [Pseudomassariella vexata]|uniref:P-loop containing nucleoside triphosphate hydrolase protein n=1 Tax=Pseudomassariella vexata TaxID=1141098 RepID=A0A1Y2DVD2_9PEZI|nr:uncharacterized protein BCR38DRAFT_524830 [Pseudomassariella vexata]ORY63208.1 hypothetical protein BCR38DRAFT_524830 [Pseudomassariella vexata]